MATFRSPFMQLADGDSSPAPSASYGDFKYAHAGREEPLIANTDFSRAHGCGEYVSSQHLQNKRFSMHQMGRRLIKRDFCKGSESVCDFTTRQSHGFFKGKLAASMAFFESLSIASLATQDVTHDSTRSGEWSSPRKNKAAIVGKMNLDEVDPIKKHSVTSKSRVPSKVALDSSGKVIPECRDDKGGVRVRDQFSYPFLQCLFPVTTFSKWWSDCFLPGYGTHTDTGFCLLKLHVWLAAYQRVHIETTGHYVEGHCSMVLSKELEDLKTAVIHKVFRWGDTKTVYLHSPMRSQTSGSSLSSNVDTKFIFQDRVVQEVIFLIMEPVFEARFSTRSHAARPYRGADTALRAAQRSFRGCNWFISGNLKILGEGVCAHRLVESVLNVVRDSRVSFLLRCGFLGDARMCSSFLHATEGSTGRLRHLLWNVLLDPLDWWMDDKIRALTKQESLSDQNCRKRSPTSSLNGLKRPWKLEYIRYGSQFWVGCKVTATMIESVEKAIRMFLKKTFGDSLVSETTVSHISAGLNILDHVISEKVVYPVYMRRRASNGLLFEKRAFKMRLSTKASIECCINYLDQLAVPSSLTQVEEIMKVLRQWYCFAENKSKVLSFCELNLCHMYSMKVSSDKSKEGTADIGFTEEIRKAVDSAGCHDRKPFIRIPEHEKLFREHAWLQSQKWTSQALEKFNNTHKPSPQQNMAQVLWCFLESISDNGWDPEQQTRTSGMDLDSGLLGTRNCVQDSQVIILS